MLQRPRMPWLLSFCALLTTQCASDAKLLTRIDELEKRVEAAESKLEPYRAGLREVRHEVNDGLPMALCSPELAEILEDVQRECKPTQYGYGDDATCTTRQIRPTIIAVDPEHKGRFLKLLAGVRHEVFYFREGAMEFAPLRTERLIKFTHLTRLLHTQFIVVSSPENGDREALRRASIVVRELVRLGIPRSSLQLWIYAFPADRRDITRFNDLPGIGEEQKLSRGVWVFRADC